MVDAREKEQQGCKMFIGGLTSTTTTPMLENYYARWGEIIDAIVMVDPATERSRGFGFITYNDKSSVDDCINSAPHRIDDKIVETKRAVPRDSCTPNQLTKTKKVFLGGLHLDTAEDEIRELMEQFGEVEDVVVMRKNDGTKKPRGFGFVTFATYDSADKLCAAKTVRIRDRAVEVKKAQSVEEINRRKDYTERYMPPRRSDRKPGGGYFPSPSHRGGRDRYMGGGGPPSGPSAYHGYPPPHHQPHPDRHPYDYPPPPHHNSHPYHSHDYGHYDNHYSHQQPPQHSYNSRSYNSYSSGYNNYPPSQSYGDNPGHPGYGNSGGSGMSSGAPPLLPYAGHMNGSEYGSRSSGSSMRHHPYRRP
jgi:RNA recognition motif-containing protein